RRVDVDAFRGEIVHGVAAAVGAATGQPCPSEPLAVARRLVRFVTELPPWTQKTQSLSPKTAAVRRVLLHADDPHKALFVELPAVFGEVVGRGAVEGIEIALRDLRAAYPQMLRDLARKMLSALGHADDTDLDDLRSRAGVVADLTGDLRVD